MFKILEGIIPSKEWDILPSFLQRGIFLSKSSIHHAQIDPSIEITIESAFWDILTQPEQTIML